MTDAIDTGDIVLHRLLGREWTVAYVDGSVLRLMNHDYSVDTADCDLLFRADSEHRLRILRDMEKLSPDDRRRAYARDRLRREGFPLTADTGNRPDRVTRAVVWINTDAAEPNNERYVIGWYEDQIPRVVRKNGDSWFFQSDGPGQLRPEYARPLYWADFPRGPFDVAPSAHTEPPPAPPAQDETR